MAGVQTAPKKMHPLFESALDLIISAKFYLDNIDFQQG